MTADSVPAADAIVWTMLFSWTVWSPQKRRTAIEMTAAGIEVAKVRPTFRPRYTFAAVNNSVMMPPMMMPRSVSSLSDVPLVARGADTKSPLAALNRYPARVEHVCALVNVMRLLHLVFSRSQCWGGAWSGYVDRVWGLLVAINDALTFWVPIVLCSCKTGLAHCSCAHGLACLFVRARSARRGVVWPCSQPARSICVARGSV